MFARLHIEIRSLVLKRARFFYFFFCGFDNKSFGLNESSQPLVPMKICKSIIMMICLTKTLCYISMYLLFAIDNGGKKSTMEGYRNNIISIQEMTTTKGSESSFFFRKHNEIKRGEKILTLRYDDKEK